MKDLKVDDNAVKIAYRNTNSEGRKVLKNLFSNQITLSDDITERVKSFEDACIELGIKMSIPDVDHLPKKHQKAIEAFYKLTIICEALNEDWIADYSDPNQYKYYPWFVSYGASAGFGYLNSYYAASATSADVGARLCLKSNALAKYFGTQFIDLWNDLLLIK